MAFDPAEYLAQKDTPFDPYEYLGVKKAPRQFASNQGGAAFGRPNVRGQVNVQEEPRPLESLLAGATKSMVTDPILGTAQLLSGGNVGTGAIDRYKDEFAPYQEANPGSALTGQITGAILPAAKVGSAVGQIPSFANRVQQGISRLPSKIQPLMNRIGQGAGFGAVSSVFTPETESTSATETIQNRLSNILRDSTIGAALPAAVSGVKQLGKGTAYVGSEGLGLTTGTSGEVIREAFKSGKRNSEEFLENMRGQVPIKELLTAAQTGMQALKRQRREAYKEGIASIKPNQELIVGKPLPKPAPRLDFTDIDSTLKGAIDDFKVIGGADEGMSVGEETLKDVRKIQAIVSEWKKKPGLHTAEGLDSLKRRVDDVYSNDMSNEAKSVLTQTRNAVKNTIVKQDKTYAKTMRQYEESLDLERELEKALGLGDNTSIDTALRKLQSLGRNNVNTNYGYRQQLADVMKEKTGVDLMPALSGQALSTKTPRGLNKLLGAGTIGAGVSTLNPAFLAALPMQSPRLMGEMLYKMGQGAEKLPSGTMSEQQKKLSNLLMQQLILKNQED